MSHLTLTLRVAAEPEIVFDLLADPERAADWQELVVASTDIAGTPGTGDSRATWLVRIHGRELRVAWAVAAADRPHRLEAVATSDGGWARTVTTLAAVPDGTDLTVTIDYQLPGAILGGFLGLLTGNAIEREFHHSYWRLKGMAEALAIEARLAAVEPDGGMLTAPIPAVVPLEIPRDADGVS